jgi:hypothetical protein
VNAKGKTSLIKFHWKPAAGVHSLVWEESQKLGGIDPDFHRRDLWNAFGIPLDADGVVVDERVDNGFGESLVESMGRHRHWDR